VTISSGEIRRNTTILIDGEVYQILEWNHRKAPKAPPTLTLKLRHAKSGNTYEKKVSGNHRLTLADTERLVAQYLYVDRDLFTFMNTETFDQFEVTVEMLGDSINYLIEGENVEFLMYKGQPISINLPASVELTVDWAEIAVRGDTASSLTKEARTTTGLRVQVPLFVNEGDRIKVDTKSGEYLERAK